MTDTKSTTTTLDNLLSTLYVRQALDRLVEKTALYAYAAKTPLPKGGGKAVVWNAWYNFDPVSATIGEGTTPDAASVSARKVTATVASYGRVVKITDIAEYTVSLDAINGTVENLNDCAAISVDKVIQTALFKSSAGLSYNTNANILSAWMSCMASGFHAGSNAESTEAWAFPVMFGTTCTRLSAATNATARVSAHLSMYSISKVVRELQDQNALEFADGNFKGVARTGALQDLATDPDFKDWYKYTSSEFGKKGVGTAQGPQAKLEAHGVTFYASNAMPKHRETHSCDVSFIFGKGAYGVTEFGSGQKGFEIIIKRPGPSSTDNPLDLYGTIGFKFNLAAKALNVSSGRTLITHARKSP